MKTHVSILGFPSDEGVRRNNGRVGAAAGPASIRQWYSKLHSHLDPENIAVSDLGDILVRDGDLESAQATFQAMIRSVHGYHKAVSIGLGGGHEIAFAHVPGLLSAYPNDRIGILNFDAHLDLRAYSESGSTSGTPFLQILDAATAAKRNVPYLVIGVQPQSTPAVLFETARRTKTGIVMAEDMFQSPKWHATLEHFMDSCDWIYISLDLDVFSAASAPGVSAPNPLGLDVAMVLQTLLHVMRSGKVKAFDIAELNPTYDDANQSTARLAAAFLHRFIHHL